MKTYKHWFREFKDNGDTYYSYSPANHKQDFARLKRYGSAFTLNFRSIGVHCHTDRADVVCAVLFDLIESEVIKILQQTGPATESTILSHAAQHVDYAFYPFVQAIRALQFNTERMSRRSSKLVSLRRDGKFELI